MKDFLIQRKNSLIANFIRLAGYIEDNPFVQAVYNGLGLVTPMMFLFSMVALFLNFPLEAYQQMIEPWFAYFNTLSWRDDIVSSLGGIVNVCFVITIAFSYSERLDRSGIVGMVRYQSLAATLVAVVSYLLVTTPSSSRNIIIAWNGEGVFLVLLVSLVAVSLFTSLSKIPFLLLRIQSDAISPSHAKVVETLVPAIITLLVFISIRFFHEDSGVGVLDWVKNGIVAFFTFKGNLSFGNIFSLVLKQGFLVLVGIDSQLILRQIFNSDMNFFVGITEFNPSFINHFVFVGGNGAALSLILAWWMSRKNVDYGYVIKLGTIPTLFSISQVIFYCLPLLLNPVMLIPFVVTPLVFLTISYSAFVWGWVPTPVYDVAYHMPPLISGYYGTGSWLGSLLQFGLIILGAFIYIPFLVLSRKMRMLNFNKGRKDLIRFSLERYIAEENYLVHRTDNVGMAARILSGDLRRALHRNELYLEYQPKVDYIDKKVVGVEALIRWRHADYGIIPPPVIIALAEESDLVYEVSSWVLHDAIRRLTLWRLEGLTDLVVSINLSAIEFMHEGLARYIEALLRRYEVPANRIQIEIVESMELSLNSMVQKQLDYLVTLGVGLAIDDFGMGHSSAIYLKRFPIDTLKVDRVISVNAQKDEKISAILMGVFSMCHALKIEMVIEYVESEEQLNYLLEKGGRIFQGYIFSRPLAPLELISYIRECETSGEMFGL
jgi:PTS system cellobiose-specific IIC component